MEATKLSMEVTKLRELISDLEAFILRVKDEALKNPSIKESDTNFFYSERSGCYCSVSLDDEYLRLRIWQGDLLFVGHVHSGVVNCLYKNLLVFAENRDKIITTWEEAIEQASRRKTQDSENDINH